MQLLKKKHSQILNSQDPKRQSVISFSTSIEFRSKGSTIGYFSSSQYQSPPPKKKEILYRISFFAELPGITKFKPALVRQDEGIIGIICLPLDCSTL
jgi:hypothetical protein